VRAQPAVSLQRLDEVCDLRGGTLRKFEFHMPDLRFQPGPGGSVESVHGRVKKTDRQSGHDDLGAVLRAKPLVEVDRVVDLLRPCQPLRHRSG